MNLIEFRIHGSGFSDLNLGVGSHIGVSAPGAPVGCLGLITLRLDPQNPSSKFSLKP